MSRIIKTDSLDKNRLKKIQSCPICCGDSKAICDVNTINVNSKDIFNLMECKECKHWFINPMPEQDYLMELYSKGSEFVVSPNYEGKEEPSEIELKKYIKSFLKFTDKSISDINYLEVGVGPGYLFNYFYKNAKQAYGIEPGIWKPDNPNIFDNIDLIPSNIKFDIVIIQDVLEHLTDPVNMLKKIRDITSEGCVISCNFPNKDCITAKTNKGKWRMIRPVGHINYFSKKSVDILFSRNSWKIIKKRNYSVNMEARDAIKNFTQSIKHPVKFIYILLRGIIFEELIFTKDQWHVVGKKQAI